MLDQLPAELLLHIATYVPSPEKLSDPYWLTSASSPNSLFYPFPTPSDSLLHFQEEYKEAKTTRDEGFILSWGPLHDFFIEGGDGSETGLREFFMDMISLVGTCNYVRNELRQNSLFQNLLMHLKYALEAEVQASRHNIKRNHRKNMDEERDRYETMCTGSGEYQLFPWPNYPLDSVYKYPSGQKLYEKGTLFNWW